MNCRVKDCYWNMWYPKVEMFNNEESMQCVSESLEEHVDENNDFELLPNDKKCPSYISYLEFCGVNKT